MRVSQARLNEVVRLRDAALEIIEVRGIRQIGLGPRIPIKPASPSPSTTTLDPISLSPELTAELSGVSVRTIYRLLTAEAFTARRYGSRTLIDAASWRTNFASLPAYVPGASMPNAPHVTKCRAAKGSPSHVRS